MKLPIQALPVLRSHLVATGIGQMAGITPSGCQYFGTAPFCNGNPGDCYTRGLKYCGDDNCGDGSCCWSGKKVLCCDTCPN